MKVFTLSEAMLRWVSWVSGHLHKYQSAEFSAGTLHESHGKCPVTLWLISGLLCNRTRLDITARIRLNEMRHTSESVRNTECGNSKYDTTLLFKQPKGKLTEMSTCCAAPARFVINL